MRRKGLRWRSKCCGSFLMEMRKISGTSLSWVYYSPWITVSSPSFLSFPSPSSSTSFFLSFLLHLPPLLSLLSLFNTLISHVSLSSSIPTSHVSLFSMAYVLVDILCWLYLGFGCYVSFSGIYLNKKRGSLLAIWGTKVQKIALCGWFNFNCIFFILKRNIWFNYHAVS